GRLMEILDSLSDPPKVSAPLYPLVRCTLIIALNWGICSPWNDFSWANAIDMPYRCFRVLSDSFHWVATLFKGPFPFSPNKGLITLTLRMTYSYKAKQPTRVNAKSNTIFKGIEICRGNMIGAPKYSTTIWTMYTGYAARLK